MKTKFVCRLSSVVCLAAALVSSAADVKYQDFQWEKNSLVPFDATTTVTLVEGMWVNLWLIHVDVWWKPI